MVRLEVDRTTKFNRLSKYNCTYPGNLLVKYLTRKFLAARADLAEKLSSIAKNNGVTLYGLVNQILEQAIRANSFGDEMPEIIDNHVFIKMAKQNGLILIPEKIWNVVLEKTFEKTGDSLTEVVYDVGLWYGKYFSTIFTDKNNIEEIENALKRMLWNVSILDLEKNSNNEIMLRCIEPNITHSHTVFLSAMLEGIIHPLGYSTTEKNVSRGIISLTFEKRKL